MKLVDVKTVAEMLGVKQKTVYDWVHRRMIPFAKLGRLVRFDEQEIVKWAQERKQPVGAAAR